MLLGMSPDVQDSLNRMPHFPVRMAKPAGGAAPARRVAENSCLDGALIRLDGEQIIYTPRLPLIEKAFNCLFPLV